MDERAGLLVDSPEEDSRKWKIALGLATLIAVIGIAVSIGLGVQLNGYKNVSNPSYEGILTPAENVVLPSNGLLIQNATVWMTDGTIASGNDILVRNGLISAIGVGLTASAGDTVVNALGAFVTPGLIDMHSHAGVYSFPEDAHANSDGNEMSNPASPQVRSIDAFAPEDNSIEEARASGVTAAQILPGSGNVMGGQAFQVKYRVAQNPTVELLRIKNGPVALKMACGENPKRVYGDRNPPELPMSRMGNGWVMRQKLGAGKDLFLQQQQYCQAGPRDTVFPHDYSLDNVLALLRGQAVLNIHCYKVVDFEMAIRVAKEFGVKIASFHHAIEAWKIPDILKENNITVALFSDQFGFKFEARHSSVHAPRLLDEAGVKVAMKTDHPVINGRDLLYQAQKAAHWGLAPNSALRSITSVPATAIGLGDRMGSLSVGKEADIVLWDRHPLHLGAAPLKSYIEGQLVYERIAPVHYQKLSYVSPWGKYSMTSTPATICSFIAQSSNNLPSYAVTNAKIYFGDARAPLASGTIVVQNGIITCVGPQCTAPNGAAVFDMAGGIITPGLIHAGAPTGLTEVEQESSWSDGSVTDLNMNVQAIDGVTVESQHTTAAYAGAVLTSISRPISGKIIIGQSSAFFMGPSIRVLDSTTAVKGAAALDVQIGNAAKAGWAPAVSQQIATLRNAFLEANKTASSTSPLYQVILGQLPLAVWTDSADHMSSVMRMINELGFTSVKLIFGGASESWLIANELKRFNASVILYRCAPNSYEARRCSYRTAIPELKKAGIRIGYGGMPGDVIMPRFLRWEIGQALDYGVDSVEEAVRMVSGNIASMYNLPPGVGDITQGGPANFVGFNGNPFSTSSNIEFVAVAGKFECRPQQK